MVIANDDPRVVFTYLPGDNGYKSGSPCFFSQLRIRLELPVCPSVLLRCFQSLRLCRCGWSVSVCQSTFPRRSLTFELNVFCSTEDFIRTACSCRHIPKRMSIRFLLEVFMVVKKIRILFLFFFFSFFFFFDARNSVSPFLQK